MRLLRALVTLPLVLPPVVGGVALLLVLGRNGLVGQWLDEWFGDHPPVHHRRRGHRRDLRGDAVPGDRGRGRVPLRRPGVRRGRGHPRREPADRLPTGHAAADPARRSSPARCCAGPAPSASSAPRSPSPGNLQGVTRTMPLGGLPRDGDRPRRRDRPVAGAARSSRSRCCSLLRGRWVGAGGPQ